MDKNAKIAGVKLLKEKEQSLKRKLERLSAEMKLITQQIDIVTSIVNEVEDELEREDEFDIDISNEKVNIISTRDALKKYGLGFREHSEGTIKEKIEFTAQQRRKTNYYDVAKFEDTYDTSLNQANKVYLALKELKKGTAKDIANHIVSLEPNTGSEKTYSWVKNISNRLSIDGSIGAKNNGGENLYYFLENKKK